MSIYYELWLVFCLWEQNWGKYSTSPTEEAQACMVLSGCNNTLMLLKIIRVNLTGIKGRNVAQEAV